MQIDNNFWDDNHDTEDLWRLITIGLSKNVLGFIRVTQILFVELQLTDIYYIF